MKMYKISQQPQDDVHLYHHSYAEGVFPIIYFTMELEEFSENESVDVVGTQAVIEQSPVHRQQYRAM